MANSNGIFPVVGVGASAGGVEALEGFFKGVPADPGAAFIVVTHLSPQRDSVLPDIIARYAAMPVEAIRDDLKIEPNHVYVLAASALLGVEKGRLKLREMEAVRERKPIDVFLSSLAKDKGEHTAAVILSGGDGDGTLGAKAIKERGGLTLAQISDGHGPSHPDMPDSAIATGFIDLALPVDKMGVELVKFAQSLRDAGPEAGDGLDVSSSLEDYRVEICAILRNQVGHDFAGYKDKTFYRRLDRRIQVTQSETIDAYVERLRQDPKEVNALFRDLLIGVTNFFRDGEAFDKLQELVIPKLFEGRGAPDVVRVWVPGCATGEEVFSIAILLREYMDKLTAVPRVQIFATDIDEVALNVARAARFPDALLDTVSPERRRRFFVPDGGSYVVAREVRDLCIFSPHSIIRDPPFSRLDLISCRNLLIYFGADAQSQVIPIFHYSLRKGGYLFLGASENVSQFADLFTPLEKKHRIFRAREDGIRTSPMTLVAPAARALAARDPREHAHPGGAALRKAIDMQVIEHHAPPHVVVDRAGEIVHFSPRTGKYLEAATGAPTRHLFALARKRMKLDLRALFRQVVETGRPGVKERVEVEDDSGRTRFLTVTVEPVADRGEQEPLYLIIFDEAGAPSKAVPLQAPHADENGARLQLEAELRETRERLQSVIEEYETALEELRASNEELVSVNEEVQSTNEEMEASKEELQSLNEELNTVNAELQTKIEELDFANNDLINLFESTQIATVFLDRDLLIRNFTPAASRFFNIRPGDCGRPLTDLAARFHLSSMIDDIRAALNSGAIIERGVSMLENGRESHFLARFSAYRSLAEGNEGVVVTFVDVTGLRDAQAQREVLLRELNHRLKNMLTIVVSIADQTYRTTDQAAFLKVFTGRLQAMGRAVDVLNTEKWTGAELSAVVDAALSPFDKRRIEAKGPLVRLSSRQSMSLLFSLHELGTNAVKYGALSKAKGRVSIGWRPEKAGRIELSWREIDGPAVTPPAARNFGMRLIENEVKTGLRGSVDFDFQRDGLVVDIEFPAAGAE